jgi:uncharacterized protein YutE (UPF0331/DUF86 family)
MPRMSKAQRAIKAEFSEMVRAFKTKDELLAPLLAFHLLSENLLERIARRWLPQPAALDAAGLSYSQKLCVVTALGALPQDSSESLRLLNALRNRLAHRRGYRPTIDDMFAVAKPLAADLKQTREAHLVHAGEDIFEDTGKLFVAIAQYLHIDLSGALHLLRRARFPRSDKARRRAG